MTIILSPRFSENLRALSTALREFEAQDPFIQSGSSGGRPVRGDYPFWLHRRTAAAWTALALILRDQFASGAADFSLAYGLLRHMLENYADLYNAWATRGRSYLYWRFLREESAGRPSDEAFRLLREHLPLWAEHRGRDGRTRRANRLTRYFRMAPLPETLARQLPELPALHRDIRAIDARASAAFHSNSPDFLRDVPACAEELLLTMHVILASSLAVVSAVYGDPWSYDLRGRVWTPLLSDIVLLRKGLAFSVK